LGALEGIQHILRLARLADENAYILRIDRWSILGNELRRQNGDYGAFRQPAKVDGASQAGMVARAAADEIHITRSLYGLQDAGHIRMMRE